jgi:hypothetical protein
MLNMDMGAVKARQRVSRHATEFGRISVHKGVGSHILGMEGKSGWWGEKEKRRGGIYTPVHGLSLRHSHDDRHLWQSDKSIMLASESGTSSTFFVRGTGTLHAAIHAAFWTITQLAVDFVSAAK